MKVRKGCRFLIHRVSDEKEREGGGEKRAESETPLDRAGSEETYILTRRQKRETKRRPKSRSSRARDVSTRSSLRSSSVSGASSDLRPRPFHLAHRSANKCPSYRLTEPSSFYLSSPVPPKLTRTINWTLSFLPLPRLSPPRRAPSDVRCVS